MITSSYSYLQNLWFQIRNRLFNCEKCHHLQAGFSNYCRADWGGICVCCFTFKLLFFSFKHVHVPVSNHFKKSVCCVYSSNCECFRFHKPQADCVCMSWQKKKKKKLLIKTFTYFLPVHRSRSDYRVTNKGVKTPFSVNWTTCCWGTCQDGLYSLCLSPSGLCLSCVCV